MAKESLKNIEFSDLIFIPIDLELNSDIKTCIISDKNNF